MNRRVRPGRTAGRRPGRAHAARPVIGGQLLVLGVVLAVFALWVVPELTRSATGRPGDGTGAAQPLDEPPIDLPAAPVEGSPGAAGEPRPAADATAERYRELAAGDCLRRGRDGRPAPDPHRLACDDPAAFLRVDEVVETPPTAEHEGRRCPRGPGLTDWVHRGSDGGTVALCLRREFRAGECFAAELVAEGEGHAVRDADLRTGHACGETGLPEPWTATLVITDVRPAPAVAGGPVDCARERGDRRAHWYWIVGGGDTLLCATPEPPLPTG